MTLPALHVVRVVLEPQRNDVTAVGLAGRAERQYYLDYEAKSSGACMALRAVTDMVGRGEIDVEDGLLIQVEFQSARRKPPKARVQSKRKAKP